MRYFSSSIRFLSLAIATSLVTFHESQAQQAASVPAAEQPSLFGALVQMLPMLAICYLIFYFMVIKPQESKNKKHKELLEALKKGDSVVTTSGIIGKVSGVEGDHVALEISPNIKVKFLRSHIARFEVEPRKA
jgi:preprotein translocase subunit YajC